MSTGFLKEDSRQLHHEETLMENKRICPS